MKKKNNWKIVTRGKGAQVFKEFFKEWTCPTWIARNLHGGKRNSQVNYHFSRFLENEYLDIERKKIKTRTGTFYRGNLKPFYEYTLERYKLTFTDAEKKAIEWFFEMPTKARDLKDFENPLDAIRERFIFLAFFLAKPSESINFKDLDQIEIFLSKRDFEGMFEFIKNEIKEVKHQEEIDWDYEIFHKFITEKIPSLHKKLQSFVSFPYDVFIRLVKEYNKRVGH